MNTTLEGRGRRPVEVALEDLPNRARPLRNSLGLKPKDVAERTGIGVSALTEFELHGRGIGRRKLFILADVLGVDYGTLLIPGRRYAEKLRQPLDNTTVTGL